MTASYVIIELKSVEDQAYSVPFKVTLSKMNYIGDNIGGSLQSYDFPLLVFRFTPQIRNKQEFFTTRDLCQTLTARNLLNFT